eukprot:tig00000403_g326.t1
MNDVAAARTSLFDDGYCRLVGLEAGASAAAAGPSGAAREEEAAAALEQEVPDASEQSLHASSKRARRESGLDVPALLAAQLRAVEAVVAGGLAPVWACLADEAWALALLLERLLRARLVGPALRFNADFMAWHLAPAARQRGWGLHRDRDTMPFAPDASPLYVTAWVPLTEATPENGCIYVVPAEFDARYREAGRADADFDLQDLRALPARVGEVLVWSGRLLHFGGRAGSKAAHPRVSLSFALSDPSFEDPFVRTGGPLWGHGDAPEGPLRLPPLAARLAAVAAQVWTYEGREPIPEPVRAFLLSLEGSGGAGGEVDPDPDGDPPGGGGAQENT